MPVFRPGEQDGLAPRGEIARLKANLAALDTLRLVQAQGRAATADEQAVLARWSGWGAVPGVFETRDGHPDVTRLAPQRARLRELLSGEEYAAAERNTLNAHYTDAALVRAIWDAVSGLGFASGDVLEPGCGSGMFIGLAPSGARMVGVELEPVTAGIAAALYPQASIRAESFASTRAPAGAFDLAIGNVPFGAFSLADRLHNPGKHSIHNHFLIKSLHLVRPGGLVVAITSRYTLDAANPAARREMAALADLVAAVRLPTGAHQDAAGTKVVTDLLILRRREPGREQAGLPWERTREVELADGAIPINEYFAERPDRVLGELGVGRGAYNATDLVVTGSGDVAADLARGLTDVVDEAHRTGLTLTARAERAEAGQVAVLADPDRPEGHIEALDGGTFTTVVSGQVVPHDVPSTQGDELRALLRLRDAVTALLQAEAASLDDGDEAGDPPPGCPAILRAKLNFFYGAYVTEYGHLNRYDTYTRRQRNKETGELELILDEETGEPKQYRKYPQMGGFRGVDPRAASVFALEIFDDSTQTGVKADIFTRRVIVPRTPRLGADSPEDALAICLDDHGAVLLPEVARLLGVSEPEAREALGELVYDEPGSGALVEAAAYLSDNVRAKLEAALIAAEDDPQFEVNVRALQRVVPRDIGAGEIVVSFGAPFIEERHVEQFLQEILQDDALSVTHVGGSDWRVKGSRTGVLARATWGTPGMSAPELAQRLLTKTPIRVFYEVEKGKRALDMEATAAAQAKAVELEERFESWVWEEPGRAGHIVATYNRMFNAHVPRSYVGVRRTLPGLAATFTPRAHQVEAVTRIINEPGVGLFHAVGAGKTAVMTIAAMELNRLRLANKPAIVVPSHLLEQFSREFLQIYPQARVLAAGRDDQSAERRQRFVARCATGTWDAVIMSASFFEKLTLSDKEQAAFLSSELDDLRQQIERATARASDPKKDPTVKRLQGALIRKEEKVKAKLDKPTDPGVTFDETGIDFIFRDELHHLKNDTITSSIVDASNDGSDRAVDFRMKLHYLRRRHGPRVVCGATATPIANSVRELYVVTRQLRPDLLESTKTTDFDTWASVFGKVVASVEITPTGSGFQTKSRLAKYTNAAELSLMLRTFGDIRTPDDLNLPTPQLTVNADGQRAPHVITVDPAPELSEFIADLDARVEWCRDHPREQDIDNILKISGEARAASLDLRLLGMPQTTPGKIDAAARNIASIWEQHKDTSYLEDPNADNPVEHPTRGALQIVFCDLGTPKPDKPEKWTAYEGLRDRLVELGMPRQAIRFIHEAETDKAKATLFAACRSGDVAVLIGSTERMGTGTNIQNRAIALHHLDCPWRPADITQRDGRILRQGNQNTEVSIYRYVVTGSFDAFSWQTVARKGSFIDQMMRGNVGREIEDVSDETLQAHQIKAIATGNPLLIDKEELAMELTRLERTNRSHYNTQAALERQITDIERWIAVDHRRVEALDTAIAQRHDIRGDKFVMAVAGHQLDKRPEAGRALQHALTAAAQDLGTTQTRKIENLATLGGFPITVTAWHGRDGTLVDLTVNDDSGARTQLPLDTATGGDPTGLVRRLEHHLAAFESRRSQILADIARQQQEIDRARDQLGQPFARHGELLAARKRMRAITAAVDAIADDTPTHSAHSPSVRITLDDWMPTDVIDPLTEEERAWLDGRLQAVANGGVLQAAARNHDLDPFTATFDRALAAGLGDPNNPGMSVAIFLKCDDPVWRAALFTAARDAVHQAVRATPAPVPPSHGAARAPSHTVTAPTADLSRHAQAVRDALTAEQLGEVERVTAFVVASQGFRDDAARSTTWSEFADAFDRSLTPRMAAFTGDLQGKLAADPDLATSIRTVAALLAHKTRYPDATGSPSTPLTQEAFDAHRRVIGAALDRQQQRQVNNLVAIIVAGEAITQTAQTAAEATYTAQFTQALDQAMRASATPAAIRTVYRDNPALAASLRAAAAHATYRRLRPDAPPAQSSAATTPDPGPAQPTHPAQEPSPAGAAAATETALDVSPGKLDHGDVDPPPGPDEPGAIPDAPTRPPPEPTAPPAGTADPEPAAPATVPLLDDLGHSVATEFTSGTPFTGLNRIRGPLASVKKSCNAVLRVPQWRHALSRAAEARLAERIDMFKTLTVDHTPPVELLRHAVLLARDAETVRSRRHTTAVDPVLSMVHELVGISRDFARDLVATALKPTRWERVFGSEAPNLRPDAHLPTPAATQVDKPEEARPAAQATAADIPAPLLPFRAEVAALEAAVEADERLAQIGRANDINVVRRLLEEWVSEHVVNIAQNDDASMRFARACFPSPQARQQAETGGIRSVLVEHLHGRLQTHLDAEPTPGHPVSDPAALSAASSAAAIAARAFPPRVAAPAPPGRPTPVITLSATHTPASAPEHDAAR